MFIDSMCGQKAWNTALLSVQCGINLVFPFAGERLPHIGAYVRIHLLLSFICRSAVRHPSFRITSKGQM